MVEKFNSLSPREKILLASLFFLLVLLCFYKLILEKQITTYFNLQSQLVQSQQDLAQAQTLLAAEEDLQAQSHELAAKLTPIFPVFNTQMHPGYVLVDFNWQAYQCGVTLDKVKPHPVIDKKHYLEIPLTLHINGSYNHVIEYIRVLENLAVLSEIRRADFRPPNKEASMGLEEVTTFIADWRQNDDVRAQLDLVLFTDRNAKLDLIQGKELSAQWLVGRPRAFESTEPVSPLKLMEVPPLPVVNRP